LFENSLQNSYVEFNRRQTNEIAHKLAQVTPCHDSSHICYDLPSCIWHFIANKKTMNIFFLRKSIFHKSNKRGDISHLDIAIEIKRKEGTLGKRLAW